MNVEPSMSNFITNAHEISDSSSGYAMVQLREWGTDRIHRLPMHTLRCVVGVDDGCALRLAGSGVLPKHAHLTRERRQWLIRALDDEHGLLRDGARCDAFALEPGVEIGFGGTTLIAENGLWIALRSFCARVLGWGSERVVVVDRALRAIRMSMTHRAPLVLYGESDLVPLAHALHRRTLGADRPFVVCDPRRREGIGSARSPANCETATVAVRAAAGGSLCVRTRRRPRDLATVLTQIRDPGAGAQLILCGAERDHGTELVAASIEVPPLGERPADLPRVIDEYAHDARVAMCAPSDAFTDGDHAWILEHAATTLADIEKATLRLVALRSSANPSQAAARLGMAPVSLLRWMSRRTLPRTA
jgi:hypothetical protein